MKSNRTSPALEAFQTGSSCAQAVLSTYLPLLGIEQGLAHKLGAGLGGGLCGTQMVCGALNAGAVVVSAILGNAESTRVDLKAVASARTREMVQDFEKKFGSSQCLQIIGEDTSTEAGRQRAQAANVYRKTCDQCVAHVSEQLDTLLQEKHLTGE
jgi:C_GCAxxG_C_C family probable redox protein